MRDRHLLWLLALVPVICACSARDLWPPDEPRYGQVAREMLESGNWLVPHVNREPYAEKPPLYWWGATALSLPFGRVSAITARLGGALYAFGCAFLLVLLAGRWFGGRKVGVTAAAMFGSMIFVLWVSQRAALDLPLTFFILLAVERGEVWLATGRLLPAAAFGAAWAGAVLVKGPLGLLFPPIALAAGALATRSAPSWRNAGWLVAPLVLVGLGLAWLLPAIEAGGEAYENRLLGQIEGRATGGEGHHLRPFYYFVERTPVVTVPWTLHLLAGLLVMLKLRAQPPAMRRGLATCAAIGIGGFLFLSALATKREVYLLPLLPFVCAATAYALHAGLFPRVERWARVLMLATPVVFGLVLAALPLLDPDAIARTRALALRDGPMWAWYLPLGVAALVLWATTARAAAAGRDTPRAIRRTALGMGLAFVVISLGFLPQIDRHRSYAPAARAAERHARGGAIYNAGFGQGPNLLWSLDRERTPLLHGLDDLRDAMSDTSEGVAVVARAKWWDGLRVARPDALGGIYEAWRDLVDGREMVVLTNQEPD